MTDRLLGAACVALGLGMALAARHYAAPFAYEPIGPRAFPLVLAGLLAAAGLWLLLRPASQAAGARPLPLMAIGACWLTLMLYAVLFQRLGFVIATALLSMPVALAFGGTWRQGAATGVGLGLGLYLLFDKALDVVLPLGLLGLAGRG